jgi:hypothetical protein
MVGHLGPAVPQPAALPQGLDAGAELHERVQHSDQCHTLGEFISACGLPAGKENLKLC